MKYVAVIETAKDKAKTDLPLDYPIICKEFSSFEEAKIAYPSATVLTADYYAGYKEAMNIASVHSFNEADLKKQLTQHKSKIDSLMKRGLWARVTNKEVV